MIRRRPIAALATAAATVAALLLPPSANSAAAQQKPVAGSWVRYALPGTRMGVTLRWQLVSADGDQLVIKVDSYVDADRRASREIKRERLRVPEDARRETIAAGGRKYDCKVFQLGATTYWYSDEVPVLGIVRSQNGEHDIMELVETSAPGPGKSPS